MCKELLHNEEIKEYINIQTGKMLDLDMLSILKDNVMLKIAPHLWCILDFEKNNKFGLDIWKMTYGSNKKVWWICPKCGSSYESSANNKVKGKECSYCSGRRVNHTNCLATTHKHLLNEWDFELNENTTPYTVSHGSHKRVYWRCKDCNSSYQSTVYDKTRGNGCPYCAGKRVNHTNSLSSLNPELASEWHPTKNGSLTPDDVTCGNDKKVWWLGECGHEWESVIHSRSNGVGCPYCANQKTNIDASIVFLNPELSKQWHPTKNLEIIKEEVAPNSSRKVWWIGECGHEWEARVSSRNRGYRCPYCSNQKVLKGFNDMWTTNPELASLLANPEDGYKYTQFSHIKLNWKCHNCNHTVCDKKIQDVNKQGLSCPKCSDGISYPEKLMGSILRYFNIEYKYDNILNWSDNRRYDFYIPTLNIIIETHGNQHYNEAFDSIGGRTLKEEQANDQYKYEMAIQNGMQPENYIVIDCRYSDFEFIKNNILNSRLAEIFDFNGIDWDKIEQSTKTSLLDKICKLWNEGMNTRKIHEYTNLSKLTIIKYLKRGSSMGLCDYDANKESIINTINLSKKVIGYDYNNEIVITYPSINQASKDLGISFNKLVKLMNTRTYFNGALWKTKES